MAGRITLEITAGTLRGKEHTIRFCPGVRLDGHRIVIQDHDVYLFGRTSDCHVRLPEDDPLVSRHHFLLECAPPQAVLRDLGSLHGTYVNGVKYGGRARGAAAKPGEGAGRSDVPLADGDCVTIGGTTLRVHLETVRVCAHCGLEKLGVGGEPADPWAATWWCDACRSRLQASPADAAGNDRVRVCCECGRPLSGGAGRAPEDLALCEDCLRHSPEGPAEVIAQLWQRTGQEPGRDEPPSIPGYQLQESLGRGGFGSVYLARRGGEQRLVAVKVLLPRGAVSSKARRDFLREIEITRRLSHPHIVRLVDHGFHGGAFYLVTDYCDGGNVQHLLTRAGGTLTLAEAGPIVLQALDALAFIHGANLVHRDVKPANILLVRDRDGWLAKLADLGLAKDFELAGLSGMTLVGQYAGTYEFMPREQLTHYRYLKPYSDVWSMAATFYHLLTGDYPLDFHPPRDKAAVVLESQVVPIRQRDPSLPRLVAKVIDQALSPQPADRFPNAGALREALLRVL
jgi:hypothetical protein